MCLSKLFHANEINMKRAYYQLMVIIAFVAILSIWCKAATPPELPRVYLQTAYAPPANPVIYKPQTSADFQNALNTCKLGDIIELQAGLVYRGPFSLPNKTAGTGWIYITSSAITKLPSPCIHVSLRPMLRICL